MKANAKGGDADAQVFASPGGQAKQLGPEFGGSDATAQSLSRYVDAQRDTYGQALDELSRGRKTGHWMWFIFPQLAGLGKSQTSNWFAINNLAEAKAFLRHPILGARLREAVGALLLHRDVSVSEILQADAMKLRSSLTLFAAVAVDDYDRELFEVALEAFFARERDPLTLDLIRRAKSSDR